MTQRTRSRVIAILVLLVCAVAIAQLSHPIARRVGGIGVIQQPIAAASIRIGAWADALSHVLRDPSRVSALEAELADLRSQHAKLERQLLGHTEEQRERSRTYVGDLGTPIIARVVAATLEPTSHTLVVAHPKDQPVRAGDPVIARGALIGIVAVSGPSRTTIQLLSDPRMHIGVELATVAGTIGVLEVDAGGGLAVTHIPSERVVTVGDIVATGAITSGVPRGIPVGIVSAVRPDPDGFFQTAAIDPIVDPRHELVVTVLAQEDGVTP
ncbi:MAG: rod shape-determining protein MreC [bacterium]|nr:rod shape-determining protein MreC [bacterium]